MSVKEVWTKSSTGRKRTKEEILDSYYSNYKIKCKCGHTMFMPCGTDKKICSHCGNWTYRTKQIEFKENFNKFMRRKEKENEC